MTKRVQLTVAFGSGAMGDKWEALLQKLCARYKQEPTDLIKTALRTLNCVDKKDAITVDEFLK